ncbi:hypothetical protein F5B22DRAFT_647410 [Xylaria bambusicola]|uniref:uncharacterized protein n=1 Tax=Xylaria bambusicola TaxID=326684 RepID=UPI0020087A5B|nr:uncharacterized protein F5B22DRAFT_647410 [Xylaria bambusicola]KAI0514653.1 hypothetical protein F5B22DRAFT_647410 [Xylaria bambusicola]
MASMTTLKGDPFDWTLFELVRKCGDTRGLYGYNSSPGCAPQVNIVDIWRKHFVPEENMLEVDYWMCEDSETGEYLRADHLVGNVLKLRLAYGINGNFTNDLKLHEQTVAEYQ